jgi:DNA-directed RNA polymerase specialized sigma24 family protein
MGRPPQSVRARDHRSGMAPPPSAVPPAPGHAYDGHLAAVFGLAREVTGSTEVAASLTSATFGSLNTLGPNPSDTLEACLLTDVHRRAVQWTRDEGRSHGADTAAVTAAAPQLDGLPADEREVILDAYFGGATYAEIAQRRGLDAATVAALMQRGLRALTAAR